MAKKKTLPIVEEVAKRRILPKAGAMYTPFLFFFKKKIELPNCDNDSEFYKKVWYLKGSALAQYVAEVNAMDEDAKYALCAGKGS